MNLTDIAQQVTSYLDDLQIEKLFVSGLLPTLSFSSNNSWWHARVETLSGLRMQYEPLTNWKQVYQIVKSHSGSIWNEYDNVTASKILERMGHKSYLTEMTRCCETGTVQIMSHILAERSSLEDPYLLPYVMRGSDRLGWTHALDLAVLNSQPNIVSLLLQDGIVCPIAIEEEYNIPILMYACLARPQEQDDQATPSSNNLIQRQVATVKLLLADDRIVPTIRELYRCIRPEILQVLLEDGRVDPTDGNSNKPLMQAISRQNEGKVRVYLADERVAKLVNRRTVQLTKKRSTPAIFELVLQQARLNSSR